MSHTIAVVDKPQSVEVPEDLALELKTTADQLAANPLQVARVDFDDEKEIAQFVKHAKAWATANGFVYRKQSTKNAPATRLQFVLVAQDVADARAKKLAELKAAKAAKANAPKPAAPKKH